MRILNTNPRTYPSMDGDERTVKAVLTQGDIQDLAVYVGYGSVAWVAENGDKLSYAEACCHFPGLRTLEAPWHYRWP